MTERPNCWKKTSCLAWKFSSSTNDLSRDEMIFRRGQRIIIVFPFFFSFFYIKFLPIFEASRRKKNLFSLENVAGLWAVNVEFSEPRRIFGRKLKWKAPRWRVHDHGSIVWTEIIISSLNERLYRWWIFFLLFNEPRLFFYLTTIIEFKVIFFFFVQGRNKCLIKRGNWQTITIEMWSVKKNKLVSPLKPDLCIFSRQNYFLFPWPPRNITKDDLF